MIECIVNVVRKMKCNKEEREREKKRGNGQNAEAEEEATKKKKNGKLMRRSGDASARRICK